MSTGCKRRLDTASTALLRWKRPCLAAISHLITSLMVRVGGGGAIKDDRDTETQGVVREQYLTFVSRMGGEGPRCRVCTQLSALNSQPSKSRMTTYNVPHSTAPSIHRNLSMSLDTSTTFVTRSIGQIKVHYADTIVWTRCM